MSADKQITSDDLFKLSASLSLVGYSLALLALEKADEDAEGATERQERKGKKKMKVAVHRMISRFNG
ncbi:hypothetical protein [Paenibacillus luteus]|uniref:hypothetical protein n=1 Tax=Paenibacillus luteus TaxID=2545753 RepID=UPI001142DAD2|nr:hypothetical protein [Paenibacillus luteus]